MSSAKKWFFYSLFVVPIFIVNAVAEEHTDSNDLLASSKAVPKDVPFVYEVVSESARVVTAYNAGDPCQTAGDPCIDASGENICGALEAGEKRCAANFVPLGTELHIENYGVFRVTDRTHRRYRDRVDIAMRFDEKEAAKAFGKQILLVKVLRKVIPKPNPLRLAQR